MNISPDVRYPVIGATLQRRGGIARHDKVAWAYATRASELGVDIVEHAEVTGFVRGAGGRVEGVETTRGDDRARARSRSSRPATRACSPTMVGLRLPVQSHPLQALVSVLLEPVLDCVVMSNAVHVYVSQADKGELVMGAGIDAYNGYAQRGSFHVIEHQLAAAIELFPIFAHAKLLRTWGGIVDVCPDASPILSADADRGPVPELRLGHRRLQGDAGLRVGVRRRRPRRARSDLARPYALERFTTGALIDEHGAAAVAH